MHAASNEATKIQKKKGTPEKWEMFRWLLMSRLILPRILQFWLFGFQPKIGVFILASQLLILFYEFAMETGWII